MVKQLRHPSCDALVVSLTAPLVLLNLAEHIAKQLDLLKVGLAVDGICVPVLYSGVRQATSAAPKLQGVPMKVRSFR
jgi:hypothetical protein